MRSQTKATRRDLPLICLMVSVWAAIGTVGFVFAAWLSVPPTIGELVSVSGRVVDAYVKKDSGKGRRQVHVLVQASDGLHDLAQDDLSTAIDQVLNVLKGNDVVALVQLGSIAQPVDRLWELRRDGTTLLRYQDTVDAVEGINRRGSELPKYLGGLAVLFLVGALTLRRRFGAWREQPAALPRS